jgi:hypothetical protein
MYLPRIAVGLAGAALLTAGAPALGSAGQAVDPADVTPPPPPGATCKQAGRQVICQTSVEFHYQNQPAFELPCGLLYESIDDVRRGTRWYQDGLLTKRLVFQQARGSWSLAPNGAGPRLLIESHANWRNVDFDATAPEEEWPTTFHGLALQVKDEAGGIVFKFAGLETPERHSGIGSWEEFESPDVQARMCAALT